METLLFNLTFLVTITCSANFGYTMLLSKSQGLRIEGANSYALLLHSPLFNKLNSLVTIRQRTEELTRQRDQLSAALQHLMFKQRSQQEKNQKKVMQNVKEGMAHELNNALNIVHGALSPIKRDFEALKPHVRGESGEMLIKEVELLLNALSESAERACDSASNFIEMLPKQVEDSEDEHDIKMLIKRTLNWHKIIYPEINFNFQIESGLKLVGDISELLLAIHTLLMNAIEACREKPNPKIDIAILAAEGQLIVVVMDNGIGIPNQLKEQIFDPFITTKESVDIAGLGLFNMHELITRKEGAVKVKDNPNGEGGTIFSINIPMSNIGHDLGSGEQQVA